MSEYIGIAGLICILAAIICAFRALDRRDARKANAAREAKAEALRRENLRAKLFNQAILDRRY